MLVWLYICRDKYYGMLAVTGAHVCRVMTSLVPSSHTKVATKALCRVKVTRKTNIILK